MTRRVLLVRHDGRPAAVRAGDQVAEGLRRHGIEATDDPGSRDPELIVVLGGDGTILRAAELSRGHGIPLIGVNLGHVGFLAEADPDGISEVVRQIAEREYDVERRMTLDVEVRLPDGSIHRDWALNEVSIEKTDRARTIEVALGVDGRGVSSFACDGLVLATPTGSTAYAFSAGGPVVWPDVEALLAVPIAAHALFARPMVVGPSSELAVDIIDRTGHSAQAWCDGRRELPAPAGSRVTVRHGAEPVPLARLAPTPFSGRLVAKFKLPVSGWREPGAQP